MVERRRTIKKEERIKVIGNRNKGKKEDVSLKVT
jgi:hypothetical protein